MELLRLQSSGLARVPFGVVRRGRNGRIEAVGRSFQLAGDPSEPFAFMDPEEALREGRNSIDVFGVTSGPALAGR